MSVKIISIVAMSKNRVIGKDEKIPWNIPKDIEHYKNTVRGETVIVGRKTYENSPATKYADNIIVMTRKEDYGDDNIYVANNIEEGLRYIENLDVNKVYNIGGSQIYKEFLPYNDEILASIIKDEYEGNRRFPKINKNNWNYYIEKEFDKFRVVRLYRKRNK
jgi:dihydrofolate reductase